MVTGHGVEDELVDDLRAAMGAFFHSSAEYKVTDRWRGPAVRTHFGATLIAPGFRDWQAGYCYGPYGCVEGGYTGSGVESVSRGKITCIKKKLNMYRTYFFGKQSFSRDLIFFIKLGDYGLKI